MALSAGADYNQTTSRILNKLQYAMTDKAADITTAATSDIVLMLDASDNYEVKYADSDNVLELIGSTATAAEINKLDDSAAVMTKGSGVSAAETYASGVFLNGTLKITRIVVDLTGLVGSATDLDIIGNTGGAANAHFGQVTAALNGTIVGGKVTCLELPTGGADDIDFYSATVGTGSQDVDVTTLTETVLITSGAAWASGTTKGMTTVPPADGYLYIVNGEAAGGTFTAGKFLIELYGT
jgi:hypothetical protein